MSNDNKSPAAHPFPSGQDALHEAVGRIFGCDGSPWRTRDVAAVLRDYAALAARQPVGEPVTVEAVATVRSNGDGDRYIDWLTEGGIADLEVGAVLMVSDRAITDEDGSGEVYTAPPAQAVDLGAVRDAVREITLGFDGDLPYIKGIAEALALIDSQAVGNG
ncbi:TPA: hypothetical protein UMT86_000901 [Stenotrophomonas maltophilia]|nr:hypothetical protein [Stenotrophomonas maltophilia]